MVGRCSYGRTSAVPAAANCPMVRMGIIPTFFVRAVFREWRRLSFGWGAKSRHKPCPYGELMGLAGGGLAVFFGLGTWPISAPGRRGML